MAAGGKTSPKVNSVEGAAPEGPPPGGATLGYAYNKLGKNYIHKTFIIAVPRGECDRTGRELLEKKYFPPK